MAKRINGTLAANGETDAVLASKFTVLAGSDGGTNFGGGTLSVEVSHDGETYTTDTAITEEGAFTSIAYTGGVLVKLVLTGSTTPDLDYSMKYE